mmetsp:Transcript_32016/g.75052  ORF Transcript_32016/g.75052 Transcript_32016/m.75052 type:complete len:203 (-) Transcript_32016:975-1583(-)
MVAAFLAASWLRSCSASANAFCRPAATADVSLISSFSTSRRASKPSMVLVRDSISAVFAWRVCSFVPSSVSHQPLCSASSPASASNRCSNSSMSCLTLSNGPSRIRKATVERTRLPNFSDVAFRKSAVRIWLSGGMPLPDPWAICTKAVVTVLRWARAGRCLPAAPETSSLDKISMALAKLSSSSWRNCCRAWKSELFCWQV